MNNKFKTFNKELLIDINKNSHRYKDIDADFVSSINLLFGDIDFVRARVSNGNVEVYTNSEFDLFKNLTSECEYEINTAKHKYIPSAVDRASYTTAVDIEVKFPTGTLNINDELKTEVINELCTYNEKSYNQLSNRYVENLKTDLDKYKVFNKELELLSLCTKLSLTYNFGLTADNLQKQHEQTKSELSKLDTEVTSKLLKGSLVHRLERTHGHEAERE
ncbi:hypothetical protein R2F61_07045 [Mollicutes bacterium LVI A0078]|nr:hypothetical protein RZE84_07050 [Mollicutes bacterium LVI A0075]WOO90480.1 hypothetical protein R2F61_07045 [Mollicutes bacterium LVI A0078]